jgi:hypothetical protein
VSLVATAPIPFAAWASYLRNGDPDIPGSGWGDIEDLQVIVGDENPDEEQPYRGRNL